MTGFSAAHVEIAGVSYGIEIRSVNGRYFKANLRLPEMWTHAEVEIEKMLRVRLTRGTVNFALRMRMAGEVAASTVNAQALQRYVEQARSALPAEAVLDVGTMLLLPGVCQPPLADDLCEKSSPALMAAIEQAIESLLQMRRQEGLSTHTDLMAQCRVIEQELSAVWDRKQTVVADFHDRLLARVNELVNSAELKVNEQDLVREVAVFAERSDISEEVVRLRSHIDQFRRVADKDDHPGRKLEFISQEMFREANTIASKANDADIARAVVEIKTAIDRIKEQVQNVE
ncbi:MAG: YicC family protein [Planctomycetes bacterium]|nr:YicC family protein [Planctomycetota bacterium]